jgi:transposase
MTKRDEGHHNEEELYQLSKEQLVEIIKTLQSEMARLKESLNLDSKTSSKPPSQDLLKKSEKKKSSSANNNAQPKRKPGGQPGHEGKTRKGFGRVDRIEVLRPEVCSNCGGTHLVSSAVKVEIHQVAQLVELGGNTPTVKQPVPYLYMSTGMALPSYG